MNLLSSLLNYVAQQIAALRTADSTASDSITSLGTRMTTAENDIDSLESQFTTVVSAVTTDTEVTNIRVGDDGVTYDTAGEAVRTQFANVKADIDDIKNNVERFDFSTTTVQMGAVGSVNANLEDNTISSIISSTSRALIGPFKLKKSVIITCATGAKYKIYKRFSNDTKTKFRDMNSDGWQTTNRIEGSNPKAYELCNYYLMIGFVGDTTFSDPYDCLKYFDIVYTDTNPLGLVESSSVDAGTGRPSGVGDGTSTALRLVSYKQEYSERTIVHCTNPNARIGNYKGADVYTSASGDSLSYGCKAVDDDLEHVFMIQDYSNQTNTTIELKAYTSFADLYDYLGIKVETEDSEDNGLITGSQLFDPSNGVKADATGIRFLADIFDNGVLLDDNGAIKYAHVPSVQIDGTTAYIAFQCDRSVASESATTTEIDLAKVNISTMEVESIRTIAKSGTYGGVTFNGRCSNPYTLLENGHLYIMFNGMISSVQTLCVADYNISDGTYTITPCTFDYSGSDKPFNITNVDRYIGGRYGLPSFSYEIIVCNPVKISGAYYITVCSGANGQKKLPIMISSDLESWEVYDVLPYEFGAHCEASAIYNDSKLFIASRHDYTVATLTAFIYDVANKIVKDFVRFPAVGSRPTMYLDKTTVMLGIPMNGRKSITFVKLPSTQIRTGELMSAMYESGALGYTSIKQDGVYLYYAIQTYRTDDGYGDAPQIWFGRSYTLT